MGVLGWTSEDMGTRTAEELFKAYRGYLRQKEIIRIQCFYSAVGMAGKNFKISDVQLPGDYKVEKKGEAIILSKEDFIKEYRKSGFEPSEELLGQHFG